MRLLASVARIVALWLVSMIGQAVFGALIIRNAPAAVGDTGPLDVGQALLAVNAVDALVLGLLAGSMRMRGWKLGLTLAAVLFGVESLQSQIETFVFNVDVGMSRDLLMSTLLASFLRDALAGAAIALLWRGEGEGAAPEMPGLVWKFPLIAVFYVVCYFTAGAQIAWASAAVRAYYAHFGLTSPLTVQGLPLDAIQFGRGLLWCGLAWVLARSLTGPAWRTALLVGLAFSPMMIAPLLFPNPIMPWPVREAHMREVGSSNFIFGAVAALVLLAGARRGAAQASPAASAA